MECLCSFEIEAQSFSEFRARLNTLVLGSNIMISTSRDTQLCFSISSNLYISSAVIVSISRRATSRTNHPTGVLLERSTSRREREEARPVSI